MRQRIEIKAFGYVWGDAVKPFSNNPNVVSFNVVVNEKYKNKTGELIKNSIWLECRIYSEKLTSIALDAIKDGKKIYIEGNPSPYAYLSKLNNEPKAAIKVMIKEFNILNDKEENDHV